MKLQQRLAALEKQGAPDTGPTMIVLNAVAATPEGPASGVASVAWIIGTKARPGVELRKDEGEAEAAFLARAEAERLDIHAQEAKPCA